MLCYVSEAGKKEKIELLVRVDRMQLMWDVILHAGKCPRCPNGLFSDVIQHHINDRGIDAVEQVINAVFTWAVLYGVSLAPQLVT